MKALQEASYAQLIVLPDFGEVMVNDILDYFSKNENKILLKKLETAGVNMKSKSAEKKTGNILEGKTFVLTGTLPSMTRDQAKELIQSYGGKVSGSVCGRLHM